MKRNIAVILAGGVGKRLGLSTPKQFFKVAGKMVVEHTVDVFERNRRVDEIAIVSNPYFVSEFENIVLRPLVDHREAGSETIYPLAAYTDEQARANELLTGISDPHLWVSELSRRVLGTNFDIAL